MTRYLLCVAVLVVLSAQAPLVEPCGGSPSCVRVGIPDGGQVQLGGAVQTSRYQGNQDGGQSRARIQPLSPLRTVEVVGNQSRTSQDPDVIIGGTNARDGGQGPIVSFRTGGYEIATITPTGISSNVPISGAITGGAVTGTGTNAFTGNTNILALDAGVRSKVGGATIGAVQAQDGGISTQLCQHGIVALANGDAGVTFRSAFTSIPSCTCSHVPTTNGNACNVSTATTIAIGVSTQSAGTDTAHFICCGDL